jgi:hypothetical protein
MLKYALEKLEEEIAAKSKDTYIRSVGAYLMDYVRKTPDHALLILANGKTITGSLDACKFEAGKNKSNGVGVLTDEQVFKIVRKYFGIPVPEEAPLPPPAPAPLSMSLDDLL